MLRNGDDFLYTAAIAVISDIHSNTFAFCGHTHVFYSMDLPDGKRIVNPGRTVSPCDGVRYTVC